MRAVLPVDAPLIDQLYVRLVDQGRRLQRAVAALVGEMAAGDDVQLVVDERDELVERRSIAALPLLQKLRDLRLRWF